jgi:hypothetical protein
VFARYLVGGKGPDNQALLKVEADQLEELRSNMVISETLGSSTWKIVQAKVGDTIFTHEYKLILFQNDDCNPLNVWPMDPSSNCWVDISAYYRERNPELVEALLSWTTNYAIKIDEKTVIQTAYLCSVIQAISSKDK